MDRKRATTTLSLVILAATALYFCYLIAKPFISPVFLAIMIAIIFHPVHARVPGRNPAALISTTLVLPLVVIPAVRLAVVVSREITVLYRLVNRKNVAEGGSPYSVQNTKRVNCVLLNHNQHVDDPY